jgi:hypothetical protein
MQVVKHAVRTVNSALIFLPTDLAAQLCKAFLLINLDIHCLVVMAENTCEYGFLGEG